jgi:hypothetical protein
MNLESFYKYRLSKKGDRTLSFDRDTFVFKGRKMFALSSLSQWEKGEPSVNLCEPERARNCELNLMI